jgi:hypothetical protein
MFVAVHTMCGGSNQYIFIYIGRCENCFLCASFNSLTSLISVNKFTHVFACYICYCYYIIIDENFHTCK